MCTARGAKAIITVTIRTENAAFGDGNKAQEVARLLHALANTLVIYGTAPARLVDLNGNRVGTVTMTKPDRELA
mgnify:CR=1 FL=1